MNEMTNTAAIGESIGAFESPIKPTSSSSASSTNATAFASSSTVSPVFNSDEAKRILEHIFVSFGYDPSHELFDKAWRQYTTVCQQCDLLGPQKTWLACCFFTTVWLNRGVDQKPLIMFNLYQLVQFAEVTVVEFFYRLDRWTPMISAPTKLLDHNERVQGNLAVSIVIYEKFLNIFRKIFVPGQSVIYYDPNTSEEQELTTYNIFEYIWLSTVFFKKRLQKEDLVSCLNILTIVVDLIVTDIVEQNFVQFLQNSFLAKISEESYLTFDNVCQMLHGVSLDARHFRLHWFEGQCKSLVDEGHLLMDISKFAGYLHFIYHNSTNFMDIYDNVIAQRLEMDERFFVTNFDEKQLFDPDVDYAVLCGLRPQQKDPFSVNAELLAKQSSDAAVQKVTATRCVKTPLTGKTYFASGDVSFPCGGRKEASLADRFKELLLDTDPLIQKQLNAFFGNFHDSSIQPNVIAEVSRLNDLLLSKISEESSTKPNFDTLFSVHVDSYKDEVSQLSSRFFFLLMKAENDRIGNPNVAIERLSTLFQIQDFLKSVWVCALEVVLFAHGSERDFPWSADLAGISSLAFFKIIEPIIVADVDIMRDVMKHLNRVEERVLEELVWAMDSPIWQTYLNNACLPSHEEVSATEVAGRQNAYGMPTTIITCFGGEEQQPSTAVSVPGLRPGSTAVQQPGKRRLIPPEVMDQYPPSKKATLKSGSTGAYFFARKVYHLAALRTIDLCDRIRLDERGRKKTWTVLEHILTHETDLLRGRHLDQIIMCCLYIICKVSGNNVRFQEIILHYRHQPQALSRVYRKVLIRCSASPTPAGGEDGASRDSTTSNSSFPVQPMRSGSTMPAPGMTSAPPTPEPHNLEFNDLIHFYNYAFRARVEDFVKKLAFPEEMNSNIALLPLPSVKYNTLSPRRVITPTLSITAHGGGSVAVSLGRPMRYNVNMSPSKDLKRINNAIKAVRPHGMYASQPSANFVG